MEVDLGAALSVRQEGEAEGFDCAAERAAAALVVRRRRLAKGACEADGGGCRGGPKKSVE